MTMKKYQIIYADPPWAFTTYSDKGKDRAAEKHYTTMSYTDIAAMPVQDWAAEDSVLFLWVYQPMLPTALRLIYAWGFEYKTVGWYWIKTNKDGSPRKGLGYHTRAGGEQCWIATKGKGYTRLSKGEGQVIMAPAREHSRKPDEVADSIVRLVGDVPRLELFARTHRPGWDALGDEIGKFR